MITNPTEAAGETTTVRVFVEADFNDMLDRDHIWADAPRFLRWFAHQPVVVVDPGSYRCDGMVEAVDFDVSRVLVRLDWPTWRRLSA